VTPFTAGLPGGNISSTYGGRGILVQAWLERRDMRGEQWRCSGPARDLTHAPGGCSSNRSSHADPAAGECTAAGTHGRQNDGRSAPACRRRCVDVAGRLQLVVLRPYGPAFSLAQSSPDPVRLTDAQCIAETRLPHGTCGADGFGLLFSLELLALTLEVRRWEEDDRLRATTCSTNLPVLLNTLCAHRHTPLPRRTIQPLPDRNQRKVPGCRRGAGGTLTRSAGL
jgi:hypothetical protein